ncbi:hypothetical protein VTH06DRAFT_4830 [Thermothelomyces fergusii]
MAAPLRDDSELKSQLRSRFVGRTLSEVPTPAVVLDRAKLELNCERMLEATERLGLLWRAHIKSHKTTELTRLQVGDARTPMAGPLTSSSPSRSSPAASRGSPPSRPPSGRAP